MHENNYDTSRRQRRFHTIVSQNTLQIFAVTPLELANLRTVIFPQLILLSGKFQSVVNTNLAKRLASYFDRWCASLTLTSCIIFIPELLRVFEMLRTFEKQRGVYKLAYKCFYKEIQVSI